MTNVIEEIKVQKTTSILDIQVETSILDISVGTGELGKSYF